MIVLHTLPFIAVFNYSITTVVNNVHSKIVLVITLVWSSLACHEIVDDRSVRPQVTWYTFAQESPSSVLFDTFKLKLACANKMTFWIFAN